jgi:glycerol-3-phosphate dehydrogenase (NAD+)
MSSHFRQETPLGRHGCTMGIAGYSDRNDIDSDIDVDASDTGRQLLDRVCLIGSGAWGSAIATKIGLNCQRWSNLFEPQVRMWVYEEMVTVPSSDDTGPKEHRQQQQQQQQPLSTIINARHENIKYLPGVILPDNIIAVSDLATACEGATVLIFVLPHQFLPKLLSTIRRHVHPTRCRGVSLIKGLEFDPTSQLPILISQSIIAPAMTHEDRTGVPHRSSSEYNHNKTNVDGAVVVPFECGVLMGANVATEVAMEEMCESTLACNFTGHPSLNERTRLLFDSPSTHFHVQHIYDIAGAEVCGALKNVIALGAGFIDGLGLGSNTKAALMRVGLKEIATFCHFFFANMSVNHHTLLESCGVADLITTCYSGRNRKCAEAWAKQRGTLRNSTSPILSTKDCEGLWNQVETELLNGQKLQGTLTAKDCYKAIHSRGLTHEFPLHVTIYKIAFLGQPVSSIVDGIVDVSASASSAERSIRKRSVPLTSRL